MWQVSGRYFRSGREQPSGLYGMLLLWAKCEVHASRGCARCATRCSTAASEAASRGLGYGNAYKLLIVLKSSGWQTALRSVGWQAITVIYRRAHQEYCKRVADSTSDFFGGLDNSFTKEIQHYLKLSNLRSPVKFEQNISAVKYDYFNQKTVIILASQVTNLYSNYCSYI